MPWFHCGPLKKKRIVGRGMKKTDMVRMVRVTVRGMVRMDRKIH